MSRFILFRGFVLNTDHVSAATFEPETGGGKFTTIHLRSGVTISVPGDAREELLEALRRTPEATTLVDGKWAPEPKKGGST